MTHTEREVQTGRSNVSSDSSNDDNGTDWKDRASVMEKENRRLRNLISELEDKVETLMEEEDNMRNDVIR
jgi:hypothetical protein